MGFLIDYLLNGFGVDIAHLLMCLPVRVLWVVLKPNYRGLFCKFICYWEGLRFLCHFLGLW